MKSRNRRTFLKESALAGAGFLSGGPVLMGGSGKNASDTVRVAVAGFRSRGMAHIRSLCGIPGVEVSALCDIDERLFEQGVREVVERGGRKPRTVVDFRRLLDDRDIDAVCIATPDHWHALQAIWACQAGKDVYIEKPVSHTLAEGRTMVRAARKYGRIVQTGTQGRSSPVAREAIRLLHEGIIGDLYMGRAIVFGFRPDIGHVEDSAVPDGVHWDLFLGPAPARPFNENRFHYRWHWFWDTGTTEFGNNGTHGMDYLRWAMGFDVHPEKIQCTGDFYIWDSDQEIPNIQLGVLKYPDGRIIQIDVRSIYNNDEAGEKGGAFIYGSKGWMHLEHTAFRTYFGEKNEPGPFLSAGQIGTPAGKNVIQEFRGLDGPHMANFIDCVRSRDRSGLNAELMEGFLSSSAMLLGNIAYRTGRTLVFDGERERFVGDREADGYLERQYRPPYTLPEDI